MKRKNLNVLSKEEQRELDYAIDIFENTCGFEKYCGACDNFQTENCPFLDRVDDITNWEELHCEKFYD